MASVVQLTSTGNAGGNGIVQGTSSGISLFLGPGATAWAGGTGAVGVYMLGENASVTLAGHAVGDNGVYFSRGGARLQVQDGGGVSGAQIGVAFTGTGALVNRGDITCVATQIIAGADNFPGFGHAVSAAGVLRATNYGLISALDWGVLAEAGGTLTNHGSIAGGNGVSLRGGASQLTNAGDITADGAAVRLSTLADVVVNRGAISGGTYGLLADAGDDVVDTTGGRIEGLVHLGLGDDDYLGGAFSDRVDGFGGADTVSGGGGRDVFVARNNDGEDDYDGGGDIDLYDARTVTVAVTLDLTLGVVRTGEDEDALTGLERAYGGAAADRLTGDGQANLLRGYGGADALVGLAGADTLQGGDGADRLDGGDGSDRLLGDAGADRLTGGAGNDALYGGDGGDGLVGGDGDDRLFGAEGRDTLSGGAGADLIHGAYDIDVMSGGAGADRFDFNDIDEFFVVTGNPRDLDRIIDFRRGEDKIDLSTLDANGLLAGNQAFAFVGTADIRAVGKVGYEIVGGATFISISPNAPSGLEVLRLDGVHALTAADFLL